MQETKNKIRHFVFPKGAWIVGVSLFAVSCIEVPSTSSSSKSSSGRSSTSSSRVFSQVDFGYGRALKDSPLVLSGYANIDQNVDLNNYKSTEGLFITNGSLLEYDCIMSQGSVNYTISDCFKIYDSEINLTPLTPTDGKWDFDAGSNAFTQVHTFYHSKLATSKMIEAFNYIFTKVSAFVTLENFTSLSALDYSLGYYQSSIPSTLITSKNFWYDPSTGSGKTLDIYSRCKPFDNAFFDSSDFEICLGESVERPGLKIAHDPTVIYHEFGHLFVHTAMNIRNMAFDKTYPTSAFIGRRSELGNLFYDEAGAINEGIADYFSFAINGRPHVFQWAFGLNPNNRGDRPLIESDAMHGNTVSASRDSRLSYPTFVHYDAAFKNFPIEDVHFAGQIFSHFLVNLHQNTQSTCSLSHANAAKVILAVLTETLSELGDLTAQASDTLAANGLLANAGFINLNQKHAQEWSEINNPINYRRFMQTFARYYTNLMRSECTAMTVSNFEDIADQYGLLLFKNYNSNGNRYTGAVPSIYDGQVTPTFRQEEISHSNRNLSVLISKNLIGLPSEFSNDNSSPEAYVIDDQAAMRQAIEGLQFVGQTPTLSENIPFDLAYNNGNGKISPGEVVGVSLNLYNSSNSPMAGVQILANDWDHTSTVSVGGINYERPCQENGWPNESEGGVVGGDCNTTTLVNGDDGDNISPVCFMQYRDQNETLWIGQEEFRYKQGLPTSQCLYSSNTKNCYLNAITGANHAYLSKLDPQKNFLKTLQGNQAATPSFNLSNVVIFEVSKEIPPGTKINCRMRVRFTNCLDCYTPDNKFDTSVNNDNDDYFDFEYAGPGPFKQINLQFTVIN